jgi:broad specificity phosphatase PhoE
MSRGILVVRHGLSEANNRQNRGTPAYGGKDEPLMIEGRRQAWRAGIKLRDDYGIDRITTPVATSQLRRAKETARFAGFLLRQEYPQLNEFETDNWKLTLGELEKGRLTPALEKYSIDLLSSPPEEGVWFSHGVTIAGICHVLGISQTEGRYYPSFCEIKEITID